MSVDRGTPRKVLDAEKTVALWNRASRLRSVNSSLLDRPQGTRIEVTVDKCSFMFIPVEAVQEFIEGQLKAVYKELGL